MARLLRPRAIVLENVAALINRGLDVVLGSLAAIGYDAEWHCIPAAAVGAPHIRDRVFILAYTRRSRSRGSEIVHRTETKWGKEANKPPVCDWWKTEPNMGRVAYGVPNRIHRIRCLGNAVVPQVAEHIGRIVVEMLQDE